MGREFSNKSHLNFPSDSRENLFLSLGNNIFSCDNYLNDKTMTCFSIENINNSQLSKVTVDKHILATTFGLPLIMSLLVMIVLGMGDALAI
jgi:hypothetical protein